MNSDTSYLLPVCLGLFAMAAAGVVVLLQFPRPREDPGNGPAAIGNSGDNPYQAPAGLDLTSSADVYRDQSRHSGWMIVLPVACAVGGTGVGLVSRICRPLIVGPVHYEALVSTAVLFLSALLLVFANRKMTPRLAHLYFQLENFSLWAGYACGWTIVQKSIWDDLVVVVLSISVCVGFVGSLLLLALQRCRRRWNTVADVAEPMTQQPMKR